MCEVVSLAQLITQLLILGVLGWAIYEYIRLKRRMLYRLRKVMDLDILIDQAIDGVIDQSSATVPGVSTHTAMTENASAFTRAAEKRERLAALAAGGQAKQYLGHDLTTDQIDNMEDEDIEKLYVRYDACIGAAMTKTLGAAILQGYAELASLFLPIPPENQPRLILDLESDPLVGQVLSTFTCELYHKFGMYLAPLTAALTTAKHCRFGHICPQHIPHEYGGRDDTRESDSQHDGDGTQYFDTGKKSEESSSWAERGRSTEG